MSFGVKEAREPRIKQDRRPRINLCGACGGEVSETELLCEDCRLPRLEDANDVPTVWTR
jgi:predicted amidophosphoribosyltransferase